MAGATPGCEKTADALRTEAALPAASATYSQTQHRCWNMQQIFDIQGFKKKKLPSGKIINKCHEHPFVLHNIGIYSKTL